MTGVSPESRTAATSSGVGTLGVRRRKARQRARGELDLGGASAEGRPAKGRRQRMLELASSGARRQGVEERPGAAGTRLRRLELISTRRCWRQNSGGSPLARMSVVGSAGEVRVKPLPDSGRGGGWIWWR